MFFVFVFAEPSSSLIVGLCLGVLALVTCVVIGLLRYRRSRRAKEVNLSDIYMTYRCHTNVSKHYWWPYLKIIFTWACLAARLRRPWKVGIRIMTCQSAKHPYEESLGKINAKDVELFRKGSVYELYRLKACMDYFIIREYFSGRNLYEQTFDGSTSVNFQCMQLSLVTSMSQHAGYFRRWLKWRTVFITFLRFGDFTLSVWNVNIPRNTWPSIK